MKRILYFSTHEVLEFDEIKLFTEMGHQVISYGAYTNPKAGAILRPKIDNLFFDNELYQMVLQSSKENPHPKLLEWADVVIVMHKLEWLAGLEKAKRIIWRSIGQNVRRQEVELWEWKKKLPQLEIVRYSPAEQRIVDYMGHQAIIRFYKDPEEYYGWTGEVAEGITIAQAMSHPGRQRELNYQAFEAVAREVPIGLYGIGNEASPRDRGGLEYEQMKLELRRSRFYFYTGTMPAPYTLGFIEAMMTGIPIVAIGKSLAYDTFYKQNTYEVADIIRHGKNGFIADDTTNLVKHCQLLLDNPQIARKVGSKGRETAIQLFGKEIIKKQWSDFL